MRNGYDGRKDDGDERVSVRGRMSGSWGVTTSRIVDAIRECLNADLRPWREATV